MSITSFTSILLSLESDNVVFIRLNTAKWQTLLPLSNGTEKKEEEEEGKHDKEDDSHPALRHYLSLQRLNRQQQSLVIMNTIVQEV